MAAVAQAGQALEFVSQELKGDRELCTAAVAQNGLALQHVAQEMKGDRELCMAAVRAKPSSYYHIDVQKAFSRSCMTDNEEIALVALDRWDRDLIWRMLSDDLQQIERVRRAAGK